MSTFVLKPPKSDVGADLIGLKKPCVEGTEVPSSGESKRTSSPGIVGEKGSADEGGLDASRAASCHENQAVDGAASTNQNPGSTSTANHEVPSPATYDGHTRIGIEEHSKSCSPPLTSESMHSSNTGFFNKLCKGGGSADFTVSFVPGPIGLTIKKDATGRHCLVEAFTKVVGPNGKMIDGPGKA